MNELYRKAKKIIPNNNLHKLISVALTVVGIILVFLIFNYFRNEMSYSKKLTQLIEQEEVIKPTIQGENIQKKSVQNAKQDEFENKQKCATYKSNIEKKYLKLNGIGM